MNTPIRYGSLLFALIMGPLPGTAAISFQSSDTLGVNAFQQTQSHPCVIGNPSCEEQPNISGTTLSGTPGSNNGSIYDLFSPVYQAGAAYSIVAGSTPDIIPTRFTMGIDENFGNGLEFLVAFNTYKCIGFKGQNDAGPHGSNNPGRGCVPDADNSYSTLTAIPDKHNGNGFSDAVLTGFSLTDGSFYVFEAIISNASDGTEEFFLIAPGSAAITPEPGSILLLGTTLIGIGAITRRRAQSEGRRTERRNTSP